MAGGNILGGYVGGVMAGGIVLGTHKHMIIILTSIFLDNTHWNATFKSKSNALLSSIDIRLGNATKVKGNDSQIYTPIISAKKA